jgi:hypothetical protein
MEHPADELPLLALLFRSCPASAPPHAVPTPAAAPLSTECRPLRPPHCLTVASSSSTPHRCTSATLPTPAPTTPSAPHRCSSPLDVHHCGWPRRWAPDLPNSSSDSFHPDVAPRPLSPRSRTFGSLESAGATVGSHDLCSPISSHGLRGQWAQKRC